MINPEVKRVNSRSKLIIKLLYDWGGRSSLKLLYIQNA